MGDAIPVFMNIHKRFATDMVSNSGLWEVVFYIGRVNDYDCWQVNR